jgi:hypothetical protein
MLSLLVNILPQLWCLLVPKGSDEGTIQHEKVRRLLMGAGNLTIRKNWTR